MSQSLLTLLHLSDLHFGQARDSHQHLDQQFVISRLLDGIKEMVERVGKPNLELLTGDIAYSGQPDQYAEATRKLDELPPLVGCIPKQLLVVPGNHDVDRSLAQRPTSRKLPHRGLRADTSEVDTRLLPSGRDDLAANLLPKPQAYSQFAGAPCATPVERPFWRVMIKQPPLRIVGLSTCLLVSVRPIGDI